MNNGPPTSERIDAVLRPFKLVKYFSFTSLAVILVFTMVLSWIISNNARSIMLDQNEAYSLLLAENLNQQVFRAFVLPTVVRYGKIALSNPDQFASLDRIIRNATHGLKTESVTIYDSKINIVSYSTDSEMVGKRDVGTIEYTKALEGEANSRYNFTGSILSLLPGTPSVSCRLKTFIPFRQVGSSGQSGDLIMGVIEINQNLTDEYRAIIALKGRIIFVSGAVMIVLFLVLRTIVSRADKIMERRAAERLRLEDKLNQAERLAHLGTMVATVSHEIKSPLGIVRSTAEILEKRISKVAPGNEQLAKIIVDETSRLNTIVVEFLDFARPQEVKLQVGDLNSTMEKGLRFIETKLNEKEIRLSKDLSVSVGRIRMDEEKLYRALLNILINGIQAMEDGGELRVTTRVVDANHVAVDIYDSGVGMNEEQFEQIFQPFYTKKNKGTGLGLAITRNIVEQHGGEITVSSIKDQGSVFTITLPR
ncbi:MAG: ATP-binding protein [Thermodesulfobacteriota bacterium]